MGRAIRQKAEPMPTAAELQAAQNGLAQPFLVAGCRGNAASQQPNPAVHGNFSLVGSWPNSLAGKRLVLFLHGYNVKRREALQDAQSFFQKFQTSLVGSGESLDQYVFATFTWPGDVGIVSFNLAQEFAQLSGVALFHFLQEVAASATEITLISHSLGAHVVLRGASILGERFASNKTDVKIRNVLLLAPAVEDDVFRRPMREEEYHFPESALAISRLHMVCSRSDEAMLAFRLNEKDEALGLAGPESMDPLVSLADRVRTISHTLSKARVFAFEMHDFSPRSSTIFDSNLFVSNHGDYFRNSQQTDYYAHLILRPDIVS